MVQNSSFSITQDRSTSSCQSVQQKYLYYTDVVVIPLTSVLGFWCFLSSAVVIAAVFRSGSFIRPGLWILCNLTLTDLVFGGTILSFGIEKLATGNLCFSAQHVSNSYWFIPFIITSIATKGNLAVLTVDRFLAVAKPMQYKFLMTRGRALTACCLVWLVSLLIGPQRNLNLMQINVFQLIYTFLVVLFGFVIIVVQILTIRTLRRHNNAVAAITAETNQINPAMNAANAAIERQLTITTSYVVAVVGLVYVLPAIAFIVNLILELQTYNFTLRVGVFSVILSSSINPILYYRGNSQIRNGLSKLFNSQ